MKNVVYLISVLLVTALILFGLYFYNRGQSKEVSVQINLASTVQLKIQKITSKPKDESKHYIILYATASNSSSQQVNLQAKPPINPCANIKYDQSQQKYENQTQADQCYSSSAYIEYVQKADAYENRTHNQSGLEFRTADNVICTNSYYKVSNKYDDISNSLTYFNPNETKNGTIVFECPTNQGNFTLSTNTETAIIAL